MAYAVRRWPASDDPRTSWYCWKGWGWGAVPPFRWIIKTTGALPPFDALNSGVCPENNHFTEDRIDLSSTLAVSDNPTFIIAVDGYDTIQPSPFPWTISILIACYSDTVPQWNGEFLLLEPYPIQSVGPISMLPSVPGANLIPNPVILYPAIWNNPIV